MRAAHWAETHLMGLMTTVLVGGVGLVLYDQTMRVDYRALPVVEIVQQPGRDLSHRLVIVDLGDRHWPIRTSDRLLWPREGERACVASRTLLIRRWTRYSLELPGYCPDMRRPAACVDDCPDLTIPNPVPGTLAATSGAP